MISRFLFFCLVCVSSDDPVSTDPTPDLIYHNGTVITMEDSQPRADAIAITDDMIVAVGSDSEVLTLADEDTQIVNLQGLTVVPGFNDSHCHWFSWREHICSVTGQTTYPALEDIMRMLSANGWTSISELNFGRPDVAPEHVNNALDLDARGELSVRVNGYWGTLDDVSLIDVLADANLTPDKIYSERIRVIGVKMYVDNPFGDYDILTQAQTNELVQKAHSAGWQIAAHAVNQSAVEKILTAYEHVLGAEPNEAPFRHRIEHVVKVSDDQLNRMREKGIIASFQLMGPADWPEQASFAQRFTDSHAEWVMRWKDFADAESQGLRITGSTDAPFNDTPCEYTPFRVIYQAVTRNGFVDRSPADWELAQRLSIASCLKLLTINGAYATFEEDQKGSLAPGKWADLVIISANPLDVNTPEDLLKIEVMLTMVGGRIEYCREDSWLCSPAETFRIDDTIITASAYLPDLTPDLAFDQNIDTHWGAGDHAPQWIQIDLLKEYQITGMDLVIDQYPPGPTTHQIWAKPNLPGESFTLLHEFSEYTDYGQTLSYTAPGDLPVYRYFKILTTESPSWVSWKEIVIHKKVLP